MHFGCIATIMYPQCGVLEVLLVSEVPWKSVLMQRRLVRAVRNIVTAAAHQCKQQHDCTLTCTVQQVVQMGC
jgi:hypothetical protein